MEFPSKFGVAWSFKIRNPPSVNFSIRCSVSNQPDFPQSTLRGLVSAFGTLPADTRRFYLRPDDFFARHRNVTWTPHRTLHRYQPKAWLWQSTNSGKVGATYRGVLRNRNRENLCCCSCCSVCCCYGSTRVCCSVCCSTSRRDKRGSSVTFLVTP